MFLWKYPPAEERTALIMTPGTRPRVGEVALESGDRAASFIARATRTVAPQRLAAATVTGDDGRGGVDDDHVVAGLELGEISPIGS